MDLEYGLRAVFLFLLIVKVNIEIYTIGEIEND